MAAAWRPAQALCGVHGRTTIRGGPLPFCFSTSSPAGLFLYISMRITAVELVGGCDIGLLFVCFSQGLSRSVSSSLCLSLAACHIRVHDKYSLCLPGVYLLKQECSTGTAIQRASMPADLENERMRAGRGYLSETLSDWSDLGQVTLPLRPSSPPLWK